MVMNITAITRSARSTDSFCVLCELLKKDSDCPLTSSPVWLLYPRRRSLRGTGCAARRLTPLSQGRTLFFRRGSEPTRVGPCTMSCSTNNNNATAVLPGATEQLPRVTSHTHTHTGPYINTKQYPPQALYRC
jgi:hypothetical protein